MPLDGDHADTLRKDKRNVVLGACGLFALAVVPMSLLWYFGGMQEGFFDADDNDGKDFVPPKLDGEAAPLCDANGTCFEAADVPSPRTRHSVWSEEQWDTWWLMQHESRKRAEQAERGPALPRLVLIGDSITERWLSRAHLLHRSPLSLVGFDNSSGHRRLPSSWQAPLVLGISGDQTQHVMWRMRQRDHPQGGGGELPPRLSDAPFLAVLCIGTNNIGNGHLPAETARGIEAAADMILNATQRARLLVSALLPRGGRMDAPRTRKVCPPRCDANGRPFKSFAPAVADVNALLPAAADRLSAAYPGRVALAECGRAIGGPAPASPDPLLAPDGLHPNAKGLARWAACLEPHASRLARGLFD